MKHTHNHRDQEKNDPLMTRASVLYINWGHCGADVLAAGVRLGRTATVLTSREHRVIIHSESNVPLAVRLTTVYKCVKVILTHSQTRARCVNHLYQVALQ